MYSGFGEPPNDSGDCLSPIFAQYLSDDDRADDI